MTQTSYLVGENNQNASYPNPPHDSGPYTSIQWRRRQRALLAGDRYSGVADPYATGPIAGYLNNLEVTVTTAPPDVININTGACFVDGNLLENGASVSITPGIPAAPPETWTVVAILNDQNSTYDGSADGLTIDFPSVLTDYNSVASVPTYSCRLGVLRAAPASLIQTDAVFMVPLYTFSIDGSQNITSLTKLYNWASTPLASMRALQEVQLTVAGANITFTSIPQDYRHLKIVVRATTAASTIIYGVFNVDGGANYEYLQTSIDGTGASAAVTNIPGAAVAPTVARIARVSLAASGFSDAVVIDIPDYSNTNFKKSAISRSAVYDAAAAASAFTVNSSLWWNNTAAITSIQLSPSAGNWSANSIATLYGLL